MLLNTLGLFFLYRIAMYLQKRADILKSLGGWKLYIAYLFFGISLGLDVLYNLTYGTIMFLQLPKKGDWTLTARLQRIRKEFPDNFSEINIFSSKFSKLQLWRMTLADKICERLLNPYDPSGKHC